MQEKYLPNGLEFKLRLNRSSPQFCLMSDNSPAKIKIDTAILRVRNVQLLPAISNELNQTIAHHNAKFPIRRVEVKTFTISSGTRSKIEDHLLTGQLPKRVFIGSVLNEAFNGTLETNPFFFQHFNLSKMDVTCDGHSVYGKPFEPRFGNDQYLRSFLSVYQALASQNQVQNSKWVWSGNTTITNCRQPRGTVRKSRSTITRHQEDKLSKAISSLPHQDDCNTRMDIK